MSAIALQRSLSEQHAWNRQAWERLVTDPAWGDSVKKVEDDRDGHLIMRASPKPFHRIRQDRMNRIQLAHY